MWNFIIGLFISIVVGHIFISFLLVLLRRYLENRYDEFTNFSIKQKLFAYFGIDFYPPIGPDERYVPIWIIGTAERLFFILIIVNDISGGAVAMVGWITIKMLSSRQYREERTKKEKLISALPFEFSGLLGNLLSMFFALIGGLIIKNLG